MAYLNGKKILNAKVEILDGYDEGKEAERTAFWERFQLGGKRVYYNYAFSNESWNDDIYRPLHPIVSNNANAIFQQSVITDTQKPVDLSGCGTSAAYATFGDCTKLKTIHKLIVPAGLQYNNTFRNCTALENITIEGTIGNSVSFGDSPLLTADSVKSIVDNLQEIAYGDSKWGTVSLTLKSEAWSNFANTEPLPESTPSWELYVESIGWDLVLA